MKIFRRHLLEGESVSDVCDEYELNSNLFYRWQKRFFERGAAAFETNSGGRERKLQKKISALRKKSTKKDAVTAEIIACHVTLKKAWGPLKGSWTSGDVRDEVVDYIGYWSERTDIPRKRLIGLLGISRSKYAMRHEKRTQ